MPLTLESYGTHGPTGHIIIERNYVIFTVSGDFSSINDVNNRERILASLKKNHELEILEKNEKVFDATGYQTINHLSTYDMNEIYARIDFTNDINFIDLNNILNHSAMYDIEDLISQDCIKQVLTIAEKYFAELEVSEKAQKIEKEYREDKKILLTQNFKTSHSLGVLFPKPYQANHQTNDLTNQYDRKYKF